MTTDFKVSTVDRLSKVTSMTLGVADAATNPQLQAIVDAMDGVSLGSAAKGVKSVKTVIDAGLATPPNDEDANRGNKWLIRIQDDVNGKIFTHEYGCADNSALPTANTDYLDLADAGLGQAVKDAIEVAYESPYGNSGTVLSVQQINRATSGQ